MKIHNLVSGNFKNTRDLNEVYTWARDTVMWYWPADTLFRQLLID